MGDVPRGPSMAGSMDIVALRDHAKEMLGVIALDLETPQTRRQQPQGHGNGRKRAHSAFRGAGARAAGRAESGLTVADKWCPNSAHASSVMRLWTRRQRDIVPTDLEDMTRFNEAIDQAIAESVTRHTPRDRVSKERFSGHPGPRSAHAAGRNHHSTKFMLDTDELLRPHLTLVTRVATSARRMTQMVADSSSLPARDSGIPSRSYARRRTVRRFSTSGVGGRGQPTRAARCKSRPP